MDHQTLTIDEAATVLRVSRALVYKAAKAGQIPTIMLGKRILIPTAALETLLSKIS